MSRTGVAIMSWKLRCLGCLALLAAGAAQADGELDPGFAAGGRTVYAIASRDPAETPGALAWAQMTPFKILPRGDGSSIVLANVTTPWDLPISTESVPVAVRIDRDGSWDPAWGVSGGGRSVIYVGEDYDWRANDAALLPDGGIAIVGTIDNPDGSSDMAVWKIDGNGAADPGFGVGGLTRLRRGGLPSDAGKAIAAIQADVGGVGTRQPVLVIGGNIRDGLAGTHSLGVVLMGMDGSLCPSAAGAVCGNVVGGAGDGHSVEWGMLRFDTDLCPNGADIDVVDIIGFTAGVSTAIPIAIRGCGDTAVVKHTRIGNFGGSWAWGGNSIYGAQFRSLISLGANSTTEINALAYAPTAGPVGGESIVASGSVANADRSFPWVLAARITRDSIDTATYTMQAPGSPWISPGAYADTIAVQPDGRLLLGGGFAQADWAYGDALLMRLNADLTPDTSFGSYSVALPGRMGYGYTIAGADRDNRVNAMALTADGKLLFAGYVYASDDGQSRYGSVMRVLLQSDRIFANGYEAAP